MKRFAQNLQVRRYIRLNSAVPLYQAQSYEAFPKLLRLRDGTLWAVWYHGNWHVDTNNDGKLVQSFSRDRGATWSAPTVVADDPVYDTRNPALGQLDDGTLIMMIFLYDSKKSLGVRSEWISSADGGKTWSSPVEIAPDQYNLTGSSENQWISPFGNLFRVNDHLVAAFYGAPDFTRTEETNQVILLEFLPRQRTWSFFSIAMKDSTAGFNEAEVGQVGSGFLCVARSSKGLLHYSCSADGHAWSSPAATRCVRGHAPALVVLGEKGGIWQLFCSYRGEGSLLRGGKATFDPRTKEFWCENAVLHASKGKGHGDCGYSSAVLLEPGTVGFVNYEVEVRGDIGGADTLGTIWWQLWHPPIKDR